MLFTLNTDIALGAQERVIFSGNVSLDEFIFQDLFISKCIFKVGNADVRDFGNLYFQDAHKYLHYELFRFKVNVLFI